MQNVRRAVVVATAGAMFFALTPVAHAEPGQPPQNCTAADLAGVGAGVSASTSAYLFSHPEVNDFFTSLHPLKNAEKQAKVDEFFAANPQEAAELRAIRKPLQDIKIRCGDTNGDGIVDIR
ncbi:heme-binding protein [Mycobacteroides immunogenum]